MSKNAIIGFAPVMALCAVTGNGENVISRGMILRGWWAKKEDTQHFEQFRNWRESGISKGVLVAVSIQIFTAQLEKSREATDIANLRSAYAEVTAAVLAEDTDYESTIEGVSDSSVSQGADGVYTGTAKYTLTHQKAGLEGKDSVNIGGVDIASDKFTKGGSLTITVKSDGSTPTIE